MRGSGTQRFRAAASRASSLLDAAFDGATQAAALSVDALAVADALGAEAVLRGRGG
jgi:hypothetical protein